MNEKECNGNGIVVGIVDSGVVYSDCYNVVDSIDLTGNECTNPLYSDSTGHGTQMAGAIASNGEYAPRGVAPEASLLSAHVLDETNTAPLSRVIEGIYWCVDNGAMIISLSLSSSQHSVALERAINDAQKAGCLVIASVGNTNHGAVQYPAYFDGVVGVGSESSDGHISSNTSIGEGLDVLAPGEHVPTTDYFGGQTFSSGTSVAAAQVAGAAAAIWAIDNNKSSDFVRDLLLNSTQHIDNSDIGLVDLSWAIDNYESFEDEWENNVITENGDNTHVASDYSDEVSGVADGSWSQTGTSSHTSLATDAAGKVSVLGSLEKQVMIYSCSHVDTYYGHGTGMQMGVLHGKYNYMYTLRFLYSAALAVGKVERNDSDPDKVRADSVSAVESLIETYKNNENITVDHSLGRYQRLYDFVIDIISDAYSSTSKLYPMQYSSGSTTVTMPLMTPKRIRGMIMGVALHVAGDVFAHRAVIPDRTVSGSEQSSKTVGTYNNDKFGKNDFISNTATGVSELEKKLVRLSAYDSDRFDQSLLTSLEVPSPYLSSDYQEWRFLKEGTSCQWLEFIDIKHFLKSGISNSYEDNPSFWSCRFTAATNACRKLIAREFNDITNNGNTGFYIGLIFPKVLSADEDDSANDKYNYVYLSSLGTYTDRAGLSRTSSGGGVTTEAFNNHTAIDDPSFFGERRYK